MTLTPADRNSPVWRAIEQHYTDRLATLRAKNDAKQDAEATAYLRGQIAECKLILSLADDKPVAT